MHQLPPYVNIKGKKHHCVTLFLVQNEELRIPAYVPNHVLTDLGINYSNLNNNQFISDFFDESLTISPGGKLAKFMKRSEASSIREHAKYHAGSLGMIVDIVIVVM